MLKTQAMYKSMQPTQARKLFHRPQRKRVTKIQIIVEHPKNTMTKHQMLGDQTICSKYHDKIQSAIGLRQWLNSVLNLKCKYRLSLIHPVPIFNSI